MLKTVGTRDTSGGRRVKLVTASTAAAALVLVTGGPAAGAEVALSTEYFRPASAWLPEGVPRFKAAFVLMARGTTTGAVYSSPKWRAFWTRLGLVAVHVKPPDSPEQHRRDAAYAGGAKVLEALQELARKSDHPELANAPIVILGWSATGTFAGTFAGWKPERTLMFIRYHSSMQDYDVRPAAYSVPGLMAAGSHDPSAGTADAIRFVTDEGFKNRAPWTLFISPGSSHAGDETYDADWAYMQDWIERVYHKRLGSNGEIRPVGIDCGVLGRMQLRSAGPAGNSAVSSAEVIGTGEARAGDKISWLPDAINGALWVKVQQGGALMQPSQAPRPDAACGAGAAPEPPEEPSPPPPPGPTSSADAATRADSSREAPPEGSGAPDAGAGSLGDGGRWRHQDEGARVGGGPDAASVARRAAGYASGCRYGDAAGERSGLVPCLLLGIAAFRLARRRRIERCRAEARPPPPPRAARNHPSA
jgi:hypothetical protein